jgi:hypothetical protein
MHRADKSQTFKFRPTLTVDPVRWPGRKAGVRKQVRLEHLSALTFSSFFVKKKGQNKRTSAES